MDDSTTKIRSGQQAAIAGKRNRGHQRRRATALHPDAGRTCLLTERINRLSASAIPEFDATRPGSYPLRASGNQLSIRREGQRANTLALRQDAEARARRQVVVSNSRTRFTAVVVANVRPSGEKAIDDRNWFSARRLFLRRAVTGSKSRISRLVAAARTLPSAQKQGP